MQTESPCSSSSRTPKRKNSVSPLFTRFLTHSGKSNFLEIQYNRNTKKFCYRLWARQSCERTGERKWNRNPCGRKQCLQVAGALVQFWSPLPQFPSAVPCCRWLAEVTNCSCQHCSHTWPGRKQHSPTAGQAWPQQRGPLPTAGNQQDADKVYMALHESWQIFLKFIDTAMILKLPISKMSSKFHSLEKFSSVLYTENVYKMKQRFHR